MKKFENVNVLTVLKQIVQNHTAFYSSDFNFDKDFIRRASKSDDPKDRVLLFMCRSSGTYCFRESDVLIHGTPQYNTWQYYRYDTPKSHSHTTGDSILAYAITISEKKKSSIYGTIYVLDYVEHARHIAEKAVPADDIMLQYKKGTKRIPAKTYFDARPDPVLGEFIKCEYIPNEENALNAAIQDEANTRAKADAVTATAYIKGLRRRMVKDECARIVDTLWATGEPNSPNGTHYMVELSSIFRQLANDRDMEHLFKAISIPSLTITSLKGRSGLYAMITEHDHDTLLPKLHR